METATDGVWAIVVAGGSGARFGRAKQFVTLGDATVLDRSVRVAASVSAGVVAVVPSGGPTEIPGADLVVEGGSTRAGSVRAGLAAVPADAAVILVHDAARPLASRDLFERVVREVRGGADAVTPAVPVTDSLRELGGGPVDRDRLVAVQTPQGFAGPTLRAAHAGDAEATDDAALVEAVGGVVVVVDGERWNLKITEPDDLVVATALFGRGGEDS